MAAPNCVPVASANIASGQNTLVLRGNWSSLVVAGDIFKSGVDGASEVIDFVGSYSNGSTSFTLTQNWVGATLNPGMGEIIKMQEGASLAGKVAKVVTSISADDWAWWNSQSASYGTIISVLPNCFTSLQDFTVNGGTPLVDYTVVGGCIRFENGASDFSHSLDYTTGPSSYTSLQRFKIVATMYPRTGSGIAFGMRGRYDMAVKLDPATGNLIVYNQDYTAVATSASPLSLTLDSDLVQIEIEFDRYIVTAKVVNLTTKTSSTSVRFVYSFSKRATPISIVPTSGHFCIFNLGGQQDLASLSISSEEMIGADLVVVADSKGKYWGESFGAAWITRLQKHLRVVDLSGAGATTTNVLQRINEIIALRPRRVCLCIGRNDISGGVWSAGSQANYESIVSQIQAAGIGVDHILPLAESVQDQTALTAWISAHYAGTLIDAGFGNYPVATVTCSDTIHPSAFGMKLIYSAVKDYYLNVIGLPHVFNGGIFEEEGSWFASDQSTDGLTLTLYDCTYLRCGDRVYVSGYIVWPTNSGTQYAVLNAPFPVRGTHQYGQIELSFASAVVGGFFYLTGSTMQVYKSTPAQATNADISAHGIGFSFSYMAEPY